MTELFVSTNFSALNIGHKSNVLFSFFLGKKNLIKIGWLKIVIKVKLVTKWLLQFEAVILVFPIPFRDCLLTAEN